MVRLDRVAWLVGVRQVALDWRGALVRALRVAEAAAGRRAVGPQQGARVVRLEWEGVARTELRAAAAAALALREVLGRVVVAAAGPGEARPRAAGACVLLSAGRTPLTNGVL